MNDHELKQKLAQYYWYHTFPVTDTVNTPGDSRHVTLPDHIQTFYDKCISFKDKSVIDIGCRDGRFCFDAERKGASTIVGVDIEVSKGVTEFLIPFLGSKVEMREKSICDMSAEQDGQFDIALFCGCLYHLRHPFWALNKLSEVVKEGGELIIETAVWTDTTNKPLLFCPSHGREGPYGGDSVTFFNIYGLKDSLKSFGFEVLDEWEPRPDGNYPPHLQARRSILYCRKLEEVGSQHLRDHWNGEVNDFWNLSEESGRGPFSQIDKK